MTGKKALSASQQAIYAGQQIAKNSPVYNMAFTFTIEGDINLEMFNAAFNETLKNNDILRANFSFENDGIVQEYMPFESIQIEFIDFQNSLNPSLEASIFIETNKSKVFNNVTGYYHTALLKINSNTHIWYFNCHHLLNDAYGCSMVFQKTSSYYAQLLKGQAPQDKFNYKFDDFLNGLQSNSASKFRDQWLSEHSINERPHNIYISNDINPILNSSSRFQLQLSPEDKAEIRAQLNTPLLKTISSNISLYNYFATCVFILIQKITGDTRISISTPLGNRTTNEHKSSCGNFIDMVPLQVELNSTDSFQETFQSCLKSSYDILRMAKPNCQNNALIKNCNVVYNYLNVHFGMFAELPTQTKWIHSDSIDAIHDIRVQVCDFNGDGSFEVYLDINERISEKVDPKLILDQFKQIIKQTIGNPLVKLSEIQLADPSISKLEYDAIPLKEENEPNASTEHYLAFLQNSIQKHPNKTAIYFQDSSMSYIELLAQINRLSTTLSERGVKAGDIVGIAESRSPQFIYSIFALWNIGAAYVPLDPKTPLKRIIQICEEGNVNAIISSTLNEGLACQIIDPLLSPSISFDKSEQLRVHPDSTAYVLFTSGTTGKPKGVLIEHQALNNYLSYALNNYCQGDDIHVPFFTSTSFDLSITSILLPFMKGGSMSIFPDDFQDGPDLSVMEVIKNNSISFLKATPSHLELIKNEVLTESKINTLVIGGESLSVEQLKRTRKQFPKGCLIYNEYGPTESTVGCIVELTTGVDYENNTSVPIGRPIHGTKAYIIDSTGAPSPKGVKGELVLAGKSLAKGYINTKTEAFQNDAFYFQSTIYKTGDLARLNFENKFEFHGRIDSQMKVKGFRVEPQEISNQLIQLPHISGAHIIQYQFNPNNKPNVHHCEQCGIPSTYPNIEFNKDGVCNLCTSFDQYREKALQYFGNMERMETIFSNQEKGPQYDCLALLSGGKDSTFMVAKLAEMGLRVLCFTLDNGYISEEAKSNIRRVVRALNVDHLFGETPEMNKIFVDSLKTHCNVCNGCFKTIYTMSMNLALEKKIPFIVTGLSRGQFFETRLTEELFINSDASPESVDTRILEARKAYHQVDDAVKKLLDVSAFENDAIFDKVHFLDFYRYCDVELAELYEYLESKLPWIKPTDTGRSTNCLINQVGIYIHKKEKGYSNYAYPYSWDVRMGHKKREESMEEIDEYIDEVEVHRILEEIGYSTSGTEMQLLAYYTGDRQDSEKLHEHLKDILPSYMIPNNFIYVDSFPLTKNGKIDEAQLTQTIPKPALSNYVKPKTDLENFLQEIYQDILNIQDIGVESNFIHIGGTSLHAIRIAARVKSSIEFDLPLNYLFQYPTIRKLAQQVEKDMIQIMG